MIICVEIDISAGWEHLRYFRFDIDCGEKFNYRGRGSYNAFNNVYKKRNYRHLNGKDLLYSCQHETDFIEKERIARKFYDSPEVNIQDVGTIWDFYKVIGYDYKKKKYTDSCNDTK